MGPARDIVDKRIAISRRANLVSAHAHNSDTDPHHSINRRTANVAVQLRLGLLSNRRPRAHPFDRADPLADGTDLNPARNLNCFRSRWIELALFSPDEQIERMEGERIRAGRRGVCEHDR